MHSEANQIQDPESFETGVSWGPTCRKIEDQCTLSSQATVSERTLWEGNSDWSKAIRLGQEFNEWHWRTISGRFRQNADFLKMTRANKTTRIQEVDENSFFNWPHSIFGPQSWQQLWPYHNDKKPKHAKGVCKSVPQQHWCQAQHCSPVALNLSPGRSRIHGSSWVSG